MIRAPFLSNPAAWLRSSRRGHDPVRFASAIEVGHRPFGFYLWRFIKEMLK